jgi:hydrogenase maturation factor
MEIDDRLLFLKYALPCASTLVSRGNTTQAYIDKLIRMVSQGKVPKEKAEKMFKVANVMCDHWAKKMHKDVIDDSVIRKYFLLEHSQVVDDRYELMKDFNPVDCKTYPGKVMKVNGSSAMVKTRLGTKRYRTTFAKEVKEGDVVVVHYDFIIEKAPKRYVNKMNK